MRENKENWSTLDIKATNTFTKIFLNRISNCPDLRKIGNDSKNKILQRIKEWKVCNYTVS